MYLLVRLYEALHWGKPFKARQGMTENYKLTMAMLDNNVKLLQFTKCS